MTTRSQQLAEVDPIVDGTHVVYVSTAVLDGRRIFRACRGVFAHSDPAEDVYIPARGDRPAQSRVFLRLPNEIVVPTLIVQGSMRKQPCTCPE